MHNLGPSSSPQAPHAAHAPTNLQELKSRSAALHGRNLAALATELGLACPQQVHKGWTGQLLEQSLGATAGNQAIHDFPHLRVELKTLPISRYGQVLESTYLCKASPQLETSSWQESWVWQKLSQILWIPIISESRLPLNQRYIVQPFFWQPNAEQAAILKTDWEELTELLYCGNSAMLSAKYGEYLQLRPKGANKHSLTSSIDPDGNNIKITAKGFYLRRHFTQSLLTNAEAVLPYFTEWTAALNSSLPT
jgi:DNA mismatch repair protein MutH